MSSERIKLIEQVINEHAMFEIHHERGPSGVMACRMIACGWRASRAFAFKDHRQHLAEVIDEALTNPQSCGPKGYHSTPHMNCRTFNDGR